jgi:hypothetical protein
MRGLKQVVELYGGIERFYSEPLVLNKIYRCVASPLLNNYIDYKVGLTIICGHSADLYGSLDAAQAPYFDRRVWLPSHLPSYGRFRSEGFNAIGTVDRLDETLRSCVYGLENAMVFWLDAENKKRPTPAEAARTRYLLTDTQYTLVSANFQMGLDHDWTSQLSELLRVTLILYTLTILNERPASTSVGLQVTSTFRSVFTRFHWPPQGSTEDPAPALCPPSLPVDFYLWSIFLAASVIKSARSDTRDWLLKSFIELESLSYGDNHDWRDSRSRLSQYLWLPSIHDPGFQWFWTEAAELRQRQDLIC